MLNKRRFLLAGLLFGVFATMGCIFHLGRYGHYYSHVTYDIIPSVLGRYYMTEECNASYESSFEENLNYIRAYNLSAETHYMEKLQLNEHPLSLTFLSQVRVPVIVTACSSNHFMENMGLLKNIETVVRPVYKDLKIVLFDLGLTKTEEIEQLSAACRCTVRKFPFSNAPTYFQHLKDCPWKPIVIHMALQEYPFVMWMDSSVRFTTGNLQPLFDKAISTGIVQHFRNRSSGLYHTHQDTFQFLNEAPCLYNTPELPASFILLYAKDYILDGIINPWTKCALIEACMWTTRPISEVLKCEQNPNVTNHQCHRFDQSVLGILVKRLFHDEIDKHLVPECKYAYFRNHSRCQGYSTDFWLKRAK